MNLTNIIMEKVILSGNEWVDFLQTNFPIVLSIIVGGIFFFILFVRILSRINLRSGKSTVLILGPEDSGKTALFLYLRNGKIGNTLPSLKPNSDRYILSHLSQTKEFEFLDYPGNRRLTMGIKNYFKKSLCIIFVIDMFTKSSIKNAAQYLYELLTDNTLNECRLPMLFFFNKMDLNENKQSNLLVEDLEREIERVRISRGVSLDEEDESSYLGVDGETFKLKQLPFRFQVGKGSVKDGEVEEVLSFLRNFF